MAMQGDPNKNYMFFHQPVPNPLYVRPSCDATAGSSAAAAGGASTRSSTGGAVGRINLKDLPDEFFMYICKVEPCNNNRRHDWTACPYAHQGEKAQRRDPTKYQYSSFACLDFRLTGKCPRGRGCGYAHGVFECWLHPTRYRSRMCENGVDACTRRICFFAHTPEQLRPDVFSSGIGRCVAKPMRIETPALPVADLPSVAVPVPPAVSLPAADLPAVSLPALALPTVGAPSSSSKDGMDEERGKGSVGGDGEFLELSDQFRWIEELLDE